MAEMTAVDFLKEYGRMCKMHDLNCSECPMSELESKYNHNVCRITMIVHPEETVDIVQKWADEHPVKTMLQDFFEKHPNAPRKTDGDPLVCPHVLGYRTEIKGCCTECDKCYDCWNRPWEE